MLHGHTSLLPLSFHPLFLSLFSQPYAPSTTWFWVNSSSEKLDNSTLINSVYIINSHVDIIQASILITGLRVCNTPFLHHDLRTAVTSGIATNLCMYSLLGKKLLYQLGIVFSVTDMLVISRLQTLTFHLLY